MFTLFNDRGFWITNSNGVTVSVQWGDGNYCDNIKTYGDELHKRRTADSAEFAIWYTDPVTKKKTWITKNFMAGYFGQTIHDEVYARVSAELVSRVFFYAADMNTKDINKIMENS